MYEKCAERAMTLIVKWYSFCSKEAPIEVQKFAYAFASELRVLTKSIKFNPDDPITLHIEEIAISDISRVSIFCQQSSATNNDFRTF